MLFPAGLALFGLPACGSPQEGSSATTSTGGGTSTTATGGTGGVVETSTGGGGTGGAPLAPPPFDWIGIIGTGQSLSVGAAGTPVVSVTQPFHNLKLLDSAPIPQYDGVDDVLSLVPLTAPLRPNDPGLPPVAYPNNIYGETPNEGMGNQLAASTLAATGADWVTVQTNVGESGQGISVIEKGGTGNAFASTIYEVGALSKLAAGQGKKYGVGAIFLTHGETDADNMDYGAHVAKLATDYDTDLRALTGQAQKIPFFASQQGTFPQALGPSSSTLAVWQLQSALPGYYLVGPKYQYEYSADLVHLTAPSYRRLGEKYAEAYFEVTAAGHDWRPLAPTSAKLDGTVITLDFQVMFPPLAWEETVPLPHQAAWPQWATGRGFEVADSTGALTITSVELVDSQVKITLGAPPTGTDLTAAYALFQDAQGFHGGDSFGRRGQLRDSDPFVGYSAREIECNVTAGSAVVTAATPGDFADRGRTELATAAGLPAGATVMAIAGDAITLDRPWEGATGKAPINLRNDHRNYAVQFALAVQ